MIDYNLSFTYLFVFLNCDMNFPYNIKDKPQLKNKVKLRIVFQCCPAEGSIDLPIINTKHCHWFSWEGARELFLFNKETHHPCQNENQLSDQGIESLAKLIGAPFRPACWRGHCWQSVGLRDGLCCRRLYKQMLSVLTVIVLVR